MGEIEEAILKDAGRDGLGIRAVWDRRYFNGKPCDHIVNKLVSQKRLKSVSGLPGGLNYYHLTLSEARARGVPDHRARPRRGGALRQAVQLLWFCDMTGENRKRVERRHLSKEFGRGKGMGKPHCAEVSGERAIVYRMYTPGPNSRDDYLLKVIREDYTIALENEQLRDWIQDGTFGFAILVEREKRKQKLVRLIDKDGPSGISIVIEVVPGLGNLASAIRDLQKKGCTEGNVPANGPQGDQAQAGAV